MHAFIIQKLQNNNLGDGNELFGHRKGGRGIQVGCKIYTSVLVLVRVFKLNPDQTT